MAQITASLVKALRDETSQSMMECKKALDEANGDMQGAKDILRKKGLASAEKKAERATSEGLVSISVSPDKTQAAMIEVRCETDFCARNEIFSGMVAGLSQAALAGPEGKIEQTLEIKDAVQATFAKIGENMGYARGVKIKASKIGTYLHHNRKVGVVVGVEGEISDQTLADLCMHIAFTNPVAINTSDVPADMVEKERKFATEQAAESGKPADIIAKMVTGKVNKFLAENALVEQMFVKDDKRKVKEVLGKATITAFARFAVGA